jgi:hypothetical protein
VIERDGKTQVTIEDRGRALHFAEIEATYADGSTEQRTVSTSIWRDHTTATVTFGPGVTKVTIDPDLASLDCDRTNNTWAKKE